MIDKEYYSGKELRDRFGWSRQSLYATAKRERWQIKDYKRPYLYLKQDVDDYILSRDHSEQVQSIDSRRKGIRVRGLIRHKEGYSESCPICNKNDDSSFNTSDNPTNIRLMVGNDEESPLDNEVK